MVYHGADGDLLEGKGAILQMTSPIGWSFRIDGGTIGGGHPTRAAVDAAFMADEVFDDDHRGRDRTMRHEVESHAGSDEEAPIVAKGGGGGPPPPGGGMRALVLNKRKREDDGDESFKYTLTGITGRIDLTDDAYEQPKKAKGLQ